MYVFAVCSLGGEKTSKVKDALGMLRVYRCSRARPSKFRSNKQ